LRQLTGRDLKQELDQWVYVGDSTNDQIMFEHFTHSVGVANIRRFENELKHLPEYIATQERGAGFSEVVNTLLNSRA
jgi:hydroxymethylpyrimidine pyrophosphatase-like HAD family hydrolase